MVGILPGLQERVEERAAATGEAAARGRAADVEEEAGGQEALPQHHPRQQDRPQGQTRQQGNDLTAVATNLWLQSCGYEVMATKL